MILTDVTDRVRSDKGAEELDLVDTLNRLGVCHVIGDHKGESACIEQLIGEILRLRKLLVL